MKVEVYGGYHSPWVQAVLLALHDAGVEHRVGRCRHLQRLGNGACLCCGVHRRRALEMNLRIS